MYNFYLNKLFVLIKEIIMRENGTEREYELILNIKLIFVLIKEILISNLY